MDDAIIEQYGRDIGPYGIAVYALLAKYANKEGQSFPSFRTIRALLGISRHSIVRTIDTLVSKKLITKENRLSPDGDYSSNIYTLLPLQRGSSREHLPSSREHLPSSPEIPGYVPTGTTVVPVGNSNHTSLTRRIEPEENMSHSSNGTGVAPAKKPRTRTKTSPGFDLFWTTWPASSRKNKKFVCVEYWKRHKLESRAEEICGKVRQWCTTKSWQDGYEPGPIVWLRAQEYNEDDIPTGVSVTPRRCPPHAVRRNFSDNWLCKDCHMTFSETAYRALVAKGEIA